MVAQVGLLLVLALVKPERQDSKELMHQLQLQHCHMEGCCLIMIELVRIIEWSVVLIEQSQQW